MCSNNQVEQLAIDKAPEVIERQQVKENVQRESSYLHGEQNNIGRNKER
jgi:hypothetical protein